eukprot:scpid109536/ scgid21267/ 
MNTIQLQSGTLIIRSAELPTKRVCFACDSDYWFSVFCSGLFVAYYPCTSVYKHCMHTCIAVFGHSHARRWLDQCATACVTCTHGMSVSAAWCPGMAWHGMQSLWCKNIHSSACAC